ncbi:SusC/RagA family TonB-linked outer membrane protein [Gracilimonas mengyeensis]|uniref:TonB-linked outer membrane protein, SusC/RagA family n=1 Tax=Gracilimonas mengyeensis TaxID=1302730 RepID=A0A521AY66_9BACT|nr:SusC/RagA family TonB-linked outer membrane protein [Gracilimonas mengyeensis]SMO39802.1 TonB-linked outer membrane protein, SusC/RagA family [Gracilimonas mengyeensis]
MKKATFYATCLTVFSLVLLWQGTVIAQQVSGVVTDASTDDTLPGVNIKVKGTTMGGTTDLTGTYQLTVPSLNDTLIFSFIGFETLEVPIDGREEIDIELSPMSLTGEDIVVVGYGTISKDEVTSSVSSINSDDFVTGNVKDAGQLIQGKVAGLTIASPSGDPTSGSEIKLRGNTTLLGANPNPLILIDGIPGNLETVAPQDIQSINVLKDGSAAAIYGTRGSNGVILITTKGGTGDFEPSVTFSSTVSTQTIANSLDVLTAKDYRNQIDAGLRDASWDKGSSTDWLDQVTRTPISQTHNISFSGGTISTNYYANVNFQDEEGIFKKSDNETLRLRAEVNHLMFDDKVKLNVSALNSRNTYVTTGDGASFNGYTYRQAIIYNPTSPVKNDDGTWYQQLGNFNYENPLSRLEETDGENHNENSRISGTLTYTPVNNVRLKAVGSFSKYNQTRGYYETKQHPRTVRDGLNGFASNGAEEGTEQLLELTGEYTNTFYGSHDIDVLGGYSYQENMFKENWMQNWDFPTDAFTYNNIGIGKAFKEGLTDIYSYKHVTNLISFFGRVNYDYDNKYLLMGSLRYEAASQLYGTDSPWGLFPAISAGWRVTAESFMSEQNIFDDLKLRVGYGVTGTQPEDLFLGLAKLGYQDYVYTNGAWNRTLTPTQNPNPDLQWEEKEELNFGVDFMMLNGRLSGNVDYYIRDINGLLYDYPVPSPPNLYGTTRANVGTMQNKGVEVLLEIIPVQSKDFSWTSSMNFSTNSNKLKSLSNNLYEATNDYFTTGYTGEPLQTFTHLVQVGHDIGDFYGYKVIDVDENGAWIYEDADGNAVPYSEFNHSFENKQRLGNGLPDWYAGWNNTFNYKNWDLSIAMRGAFDFQILNFSRMFYENPSIQEYNRLSSAYDPVFGREILSSDMPLEFNSYYVEDGDYWKVDNITLGYQIPVSAAKYFKSIRVYASSLNTSVFTDYKGIDPEVTLFGDGNGLAPGNDYRDKYPTTRTFTLGIDIKF